jgi:rod shape-determining protein MreC
VGAPVLTSGEGGVFPRGLPLGTVTAVSLDDGPFLAIEVAPAARPGTLAEVLVLAGPPGELARR